MRKVLPNRHPSPGTVRTEIRNLRRFFSEYGQSGVVMSGAAVDALCERFRGFEIDLDNETMDASAPGPIGKLSYPKGPPEIARRWGIPFEGSR